MKVDDAVAARLARLFAGATAVAVIGAEEVAAAASLPVAAEGRVGGALVAVEEEDALPELVASAAARTAPGGIVVLLGGGSRGLRGAVRRLFRGPPPVALEALCESLLLARFADVGAEAAELEPPIAWGRVPVLEDRAAA